MKITFIKPNIGRMEHSLYVDEGRMEPLMLAVLAGLTPPDVECVLYDDRMESIPFDEPTDLAAVRTALREAGIEYESAESSFVPSVTVPLDEDGARKVFRLIEALEDCDDVQNVYANFDVSDEVMAAVG